MKHLPTSDYLYKNNSTYHIYHPTRKIKISPEMSINLYIEKTVWCDMK